MKIGIFAYRQYPFISANTAIAYTLGEQIENDYGADIVYIGRLQDSSQNKINSYKKGKICFINEKPQSNPSHIKNQITRLLGDKHKYGKDAHALKNIIKIEKIDALICVIAPVDDIMISSCANLDIPTYLYQLDPFYNNGDVDDEKRKRKFIKILSKTSHLFTTDLLFDIMKEDVAFKGLLHKMTAVQFPKLLKPQASEKIKSEKKDITLCRNTL